MKTHYSGLDMTKKRSGCSPAARLPARVFSALLPPICDTSALPVHFEPQETTASRCSANGDSWAAGGARGAGGTQGWRRGRWICNARVSDGGGRQAWCAKASSVEAERHTHTPWERRGEGEWSHGWPGPSRVGPTHPARPRLSKRGGQCFLSHHS